LRTTTQQLSHDTKHQTFPRKQPAENKQTKRIVKNSLQATHFSAFLACHKHNVFVRIPAREARDKLANCQKKKKKFFLE
jgi:hypothetical protein